MEKIKGILLIDKEKGISSYDVIRRVKKILQVKQKIGHAGTLDPFATGLLVLLLDREYTKKFEEFLNMRKKYETIVEFGYETDTLDSEGEVVSKVEGYSLSEKKIKNSLKGLQGKMEQVSPRYSAKKIDGTPAYKLARQGKDFTPPTKEVEVYDFVLDSLIEESGKIVSGKFKIECSSGCYIRALVRDLGRDIGSLANCVELRRSQIGEYGVEDAVKSQDLEDFSLEDLRRGMVL